MLNDSNIGFDNDTKKGHLSILMELLGNIQKCLIN